MGLPTRITSGNVLNESLHITSGCSLLIYWLFRPYIHMVCAIIMSYMCNIFFYMS